MVELVMLEDLDADRLGWVAHLYGRADAKYRREEILEHVFKRSPAGPGMHAFAMDGARPVGHAAIIPMPGRRGSEPLRTGKLEALFVEASHRGVRQDGQSLARTLLDRLYEFADERGIAVIHAFTPIPQIIRFLEFPGVGERSLVSLVNPTRWSERLVALPQRALLTAARVRGGAVAAPRTRPASADDIDLVAAPLPPAGHWTLVASDGWDWYRSSPLVRVVETGGRRRARALVQVPGKPGESVRLVGWQPEHPGVGSALPLLATLALLARETGAPTLRFQAWGSPAGDGALTRACQLLGFIPRADLSTLWVRSPDPTLARADAPVSTPLFYLGL